MPDFFMPASIAAANNPYLPQPTEEERRAAGLGALAHALIGIGAGISQAGAQGQSWAAGIAPGALLASNMLAHDQQQAATDRQRQMAWNIQAAELQDKRDERARKLAAIGAAASDIAGMGDAPGVTYRPPAINLAPDFTGRVAGDESGGSYTAQNAKGSGAYGKYQFMPDTWAGVAKAHPDLNLPFDLRKATPDQQEAAMRALVADNADGLRTAGFMPTQDNLYLAHRFGVNGAGTMLRADPNAPLASLYPASWLAQNPDMQGKTAGQFRQGVQQRYGATPVSDTGDQPPALADVPKPMLPREDAARISRMVAAGAITPEQGYQMRDKIVGDMWNAAREQARTRYQADVDIWKANRQQQAEEGRYQRGRADQGEWVRGADGNEVWIPKTELKPGTVRAEKPPAPGTDAGDIHILNNGDPASREYLGAHQRVATKMIDGPGGVKYTPDMTASGYRPPTYVPPTAAPPAAAPAPGSGPTAPAGLVPVPSDKPLTESQGKDYSYASRLANNIPQLEAMVKGDDGKYSTAKLPGILGRVVAGSTFYPESWNSDEAKAFRRVTNDIVTAILRRESGANIPAGEYLPEFTKYIPQPGDSHAEIAAKLKSLKIVSRTFAEASGRPMTEFGNVFDTSDQGAQKPAPIRIDMSGRRQ